MPPIIIGIALLATSGGLLFGTTLLSLTELGAMALFGATMVLNGVTQLLQKPASAPSVVTDLGSSQVSIRQPLAPWQVVYGRDRRGGVFTYLVATGFNNQHLNMVITMAGHQVTDIPAMYFDGVQVPVDGNGDGTGQYGNTDGGGAWVHWEKKLGAPGEPAFPGLIAQAPSQWTVNHRQDGRASCYVRLRWNATLFPNGAPTITFDIKGKPVFDPRTGLTAYSENPALCTRDYLIDPVIGLAESTASIDDTLVIAAANVCDQSVALRSGGSEAQYACNGSFSLDQVPKDIITGLLSAMAGTAVYAEGKWKMYAAAFRGTSITLTDNDLRDSMKVQTLLSRRDLCNGVKGIYRDPNNQWQPGDFPSVQNAAYIAQDNGFAPTQNKSQWASGVGYQLGDCVFDNGNAWWCKVPHNSTVANEPSAAGGAAAWTVAPETIWFDLALQYEISPSRAQRLGKIQLEKTRRQIDVQFPGRLNALQPEVCDVVQISRPARFGWNPKTFECYNSQFKVFQGQNNANEIGCDLGLRETDAAVYAWSPTTDETVLQFVGTVITGDGAGSNALKYFFDIGVAANGVAYQASVVVKNQGTQPIFIGSQYSTSAAIPAGATQNVTLNFTGNGVLDAQLRFQTNSPTDLLNVLATSPIIAKVSDGVNLIPVAGRDFSLFSSFGGENITLTQNKPSLPNMAVVLPPTVLTASNDTFTRLDGIKKTRIKATWTPPVDQFVLNGGWIHMEVSDHADGSSPKIWKFGARVTGAETLAYYEQALDSHTYDVRISAENASGARSTPLEADGLVVSDAFSQITSTSFGSQGSIRPTSFPAWTIATNSNNGSGACTNRLTAPATTLPLTDGTSISMPAADATWPGVLAGTITYFYAPRYKIADGTVHWAGFSGVNVNGDPNTVPLTTAGTTDQKNQLSVNQNFDGYIPLSDGFIQVTTPNNGGTGGGSSGGDPSCVWEEELVEAITDRGHGIYRLGDIKARAGDVTGDLIKGRDIATGEPRFREVIRRQREACYDWYNVGGRLLTPCEPIWCERSMTWKTAHDLGMQKFAFLGYKISLIVEGESDDDHNFILMPKTEDQAEMVVHNGPLPRS
jgi:hypothetical protein